MSNFNSDKEVEIIINDAQGVAGLQKIIFPSVDAIRELTEDQITLIPNYIAILIDKDADIAKLMFEDTEKAQEQVRYIHTTVPVCNPEYLKQDLLEQFQKAADYFQETGKNSYVVNIDPVGFAPLNKDIHEKYEKARIKSILVTLVTVVYILFSVGYALTTADDPKEATSILLRGMAPLFILVWLSVTLLNRSREIKQQMEKLAKLQIAEREELEKCDAKF